MKDIVTAYESIKKLQKRQFCLSKTDFLPCTENEQELYR